jgi:hypothetical protein
MIIAQVFFLGNTHTFYQVAWLRRGGGGVLANCFGPAKTRQKKWEGKLENNVTRLRDTTPAVSRLGTDQGGEKNNGSRTEIDRSVVINTRGQDEWFGFTNSMNMRCGAEVNGLVVVVVHFHFCVVVLLGLSSSPPHAPPKVGEVGPCHNQAWNTTARQRIKAPFRFFVVKSLPTSSLFSLCFLFPACRLASSLPRSNSGWATS